MQSISQLNQAYQEHGIETYVKFYYSAGRLCVKVKSSRTRRHLLIGGRVYRHVSRMARKYQLMEPLGRILRPLRRNRCPGV